MAEDYLNIGSSPTDEDCVQVNKEGDYITSMRRECFRFRDLLRKKFGLEPVGARLAVKAFPHDFGTYYEVVCYFDDSLSDSMDYAFAIEANMPEIWGDDMPFEWKGWCGKDKEETR